MFRAQANPMDDAVVKATDENLTSENWEYILDVCDRVSASPSGPAHATSALIKRLAHRNANVQLYTLELANALSQNCGIALHRELASKAFTDSLLRLAGDRNTHAQVKQKVLERMAGWTEEFRPNPELGIMEQAYQKLRLLQPGLMAPSKPQKMVISSEERRKEEEELQMALALSVQDKGNAGAGSGSPVVGRGGEEQQSSGGVGQQQQQGTTAATVSRVRALYDFTPSEPGELAFKKNDVIAVLESVYKDWWKGSLHGQTGIFPLNYVEKLQDPTKEELERDAQMEAEVFGEIRNVEKLLALLSVGDGVGNRRGEREEEEIADLYQRTLSIRPKLIELIGKYSQKKDDMTQLNEKFIKARRDYEHLLERSMAAPQYHQQYPVRPRQPSYPPSQAPYNGPPAGYPPQGPPSAQGYPPQQPFASQSQQHLPPQQDPQRFYSPAPSEPPGPSYSSPYPQSNGPPPANGGAAPFHFIPGGLQVPPPGQQQPPPQQQQQQNLPPPEPAPQQVAIRRKPSPGSIPPAGTDPYASQQLPPPGGPGFQGQIRPNSIHTLNSGNPQELATSGYESPIDNRHSYPSTFQGGGQPGYPSLQPPQQAGYPPDQQGYPPYQQHQPPPPQQQQQRNDRDGLPSRQRTGSFESPTSMYSSHPSAGPADYSDAGYGGQPGALPPPPLGEGVGSGYQYQAFSPTAAQQQQQQQQQGQGQVGGGDPGDYYR